MKLKKIESLISDINTNISNNISLLSKNIRSNTYENKSKKLFKLDESVITDISDYEKDVLEQFKITKFKDLKNLSVASIYKGFQQVSYNELDSIVNKANVVYNDNINKVSNEVVKINYQNPEHYDLVIFYSLIQYASINSLSSLCSKVSDIIIKEYRHEELKRKEEIKNLSLFNRLLPNKKKKSIKKSYDINKNTKDNYVIDLEKKVYSINKFLVLSNSNYPILNYVKKFYLLINQIVELLKCYVDNELLEEILSLQNVYINNISTNIVNKLYVIIENEFNPSVDVNVNNIQKNIFDEILSINLLNEHMKCTLRKYQEFAVKMCIYEKRVLLGDEMGLGKTVQALSLITHLYNNNKNRSIVIVPLTLSYSWASEITKHTNLKFYNLRDEGYKSKWFELGGLLIATYESVNKYIEYLKDIKFDVTVVDECHYIKSPTAKRTNNCIKVLNNSEYALLMSGTPLENSLREMIHMFSLLKYNVEPLNEINISAPKFKNIITKKYIRRKRVDVLKELPTKDEIDITVELTKKEIEIYKRDLLSHNYQQTRQLSFNIGNESTKLAIIKDICEEATQINKRVLIFSKYLKTLDLINNAIPNSIGIINGSVTASERFNLISKLEDSKNGVLCAQSIAGGVGLNIQAASIVIICEPQDKPTTEDQAISRVYRMGQVNNVVVYRIYAPKTIEKIVRAKLDEKREIFMKYADSSTMGEFSSNLDKEIDQNAVMNEAILMLNENNSYKLEDVTIIEEPKLKNLSVTNFCKYKHQPRGGYLPISKFNKIQNVDNEEISYTLAPSIIGLTIDYLSRIEITDKPNSEIFNIAQKAAVTVNEISKFTYLLSLVDKGLSDISIISAARLSTLDSVYRAGAINSYDLELEVQKEDIESIRKMVNRVVDFHNKYNIIDTGMTFNGSYTPVVSKGDADFLTEDGLFDLKVIKAEPTSKHTLQILIYYILSIKKYNNIKKLGFFNPKYNTEYIINVSDIDKNMMEELKNEIEYI